LYTSGTVVLVEELSVVEASSCLEHPFNMARIIMIIGIILICFVSMFCLRCTSFPYPSGKKIIFTEGNVNTAHLSIGLDRKRAHNKVEAGR
jgi:hypothetical protein